MIKVSEAVSLSKNIEFSAGSAELFLHLETGVNLNCSNMERFLLSISMLDLKYYNAIYCIKEDNHGACLFLYKPSMYKDIFIKVRPKITLPPSKYSVRIAE